MSDVTVLGRRGYGRNGIAVHRGDTIDEADGSADTPSKRPTARSSMPRSRAAGTTPGGTAGSGSGYDTFRWAGEDPDELIAHVVAHLAAAAQVPVARPATWR